MDEIRVKQASGGEARVPRLGETWRGPSRFDYICTEELDRNGAHGQVEMRSIDLRAPSALLLLDLDRLDGWTFVAAPTSPQPGDRVLVKGNGHVGLADGLYTVGKPGEAPTPLREAAVTSFEPASLPNPGDLLVIETAGDDEVFGCAEYLEGAEDIPLFEPRVAGGGSFAKPVGDWYEAVAEGRAEVIGITSAKAGELRARVAELEALVATVKRDLNEAHEQVQRLERTSELLTTHRVAAEKHSAAHLELAAKWLSRWLATPDGRLVQETERALQEAEHRGEIARAGSS